MTDFVRTAQSFKQGSRTLSREYFTSPDIYALEHERIFGRHWLCAGRAEQIEKLGQYVLLELEHESLILTRDRDGVPHTFFNLCRHRGTKLCVEESGQLAQSIQCPYHAWTYALDGSLIGAPHMDMVQDFDKADYPLHQAHLVEWEGFLFVNLHREPQPFEDWFAPLIARLPKWGLADLRTARRVIYDVAANWKIIAQNYSECYHCPLVHPDLAERTPYLGGMNDLTEGPFLGGYMDMNYPSLSISTQRVADPLSGIQGDDLQRVYYYTVFPNALISPHPDYVMLHTLWPRGLRRTLVTCEWMFHPLLSKNWDSIPTMLRISGTPSTARTGRCASAPNSAFSLPATPLRPTPVRNPSSPPSTATTSPP
ncbi:MAG: aromatic ring-hydroxylating dioxygenase subunit alpha [Chloroflexi bacterium]|nr:aromatic ring-hydroxylating dioxygenase subunit alpha [Chloroflexota bacterium]